VFSLATDAAPGRPNEDFVVVAPGAAVVVDGAGVPQGGCTHGVAWYSRHLAVETMAVLLDDLTVGLQDVLANGLARVARLHQGTCDLSSPNTPCAAVGILRVGDEFVETLALSDASIVVDIGGDPQVTCDLSIEALNGTEQDTLAGLVIGTPEHAQALADLVERQTRTRNRADGWWVAAADPEAAYHAETNSYPRAEVRAAAAMTDGATRPVDQMKVHTWRDHFDLLAQLGPAGLITQVRAIEAHDPDGVAYPRTKKHDDATVALAAAL